MSTEAGSSEATAEDKPAEAGESEKVIITTTGEEEAKSQSAASQLGSKKRGFSEMTGAREQAATEKE